MNAFLLEQDAVYQLFWGFDVMNVQSDPVDLRGWFRAQFAVLIQVLQEKSSKEYYENEIVDEARPLSGFFPTRANLFTEMHF